MSPTDISTFAETQLTLLQRELDAELLETADLISSTPPAVLQRSGHAILNLVVSAQRTGLGGKTVVELSLDSAVGSGDLPEHGIRVGDIVGIQEQVSGSAKKKEKTEVLKRGVEGVVLKVTPVSVSVAAGKEDVDLPTGKIWLFVVLFFWMGMMADLYDSVKLANDVTYKRYTPQIILILISEFLIMGLG
jgi:DNA polymerase alpha-associated DNA helicase A